MGIKYCKACKKPMKAADSHCRTCGAEYKNSVAVPLIILVIIVAIALAVYLLNKDESTKPATNDAPSQVKKDTSSNISNWILDSSTDPIDGVQTHAATVQALDYETKAKVNSEFTMACRSSTGITNVVMSATYPMKTESFNSDGPMARYYMKVDQNEPLSGIARAASNNTVIILDPSQSKTVMDQLKPNSKVIFQMSSVKDTLMTYEADLNGATAVIEKIKKGCVPKTGQKS